MELAPGLPDVPRVPLQQILLCGIQLCPEPDLEAGEEYAKPAPASGIDDRHNQAIEWIERGRDLCAVLGPEARLLARLVTSREVAPFEEAKNQETMTAAIDVPWAGRYYLYRNHGPGSYLPESFEGQVRGLRDPDLIPIPPNGGATWVRGPTFLKPWPYYDPDSAAEERFLNLGTTAAALLVDRPTSPASLIGNGLVPPGSLVVLYGRPGIGKTWVVVDLALAGSCARPWMGWLEIPRPLKIGLCLFEMPRTILWERMEAILEQRELPRAGLGNVRILTPDLLDRSSIDILSKDDFVAVRGFSKGLDLVVFDAFQRTHSQPENEAEKIGAVLKAYDRIRRETGAVVMLVHHEKKVDKETDDMDALRGSTRLQSDPQGLFRLSKPAGMNLKRLSVVKSNFGLIPDDTWLSDTKSGCLVAVDGPDTEGAEDRLWRFYDWALRENRFVTPEEGSEALEREVKAPAVADYARKLHEMNLAMRDEVLTKNGKKKFAYKMIPKGLHT